MNSEWNEANYTKDKKDHQNDPNITQACSKQNKNKGGLKSPKGSNKSLGKKKGP